MLWPASVRSGVESPFAWLRLAAALALATVGTVGMWSVPVVLPVVQADFGVARADASLPFTLAMLGFALGGVLMGRLADAPSPISTCMTANWVRFGARPAPA